MWGSARPGKISLLAVLILCAPAAFGQNEEVPFPGQRGESALRERQEETLVPGQVDEEPIPGQQLAAPAPLPAVERRGYRVVELSSDLPGVAAAIDSRLKNPWGIAFGLNTPIWVANNGNGVVTQYHDTGTLFPTAVSPRVVVVPNARTHAVQGAASPTGLIFNRSEDFPVRANARFGPARFIMTTGDGLIVGYSPAVAGDRGFVQVDRSGMRAVYKGLTDARTPAGHFLYVANFRDGVIEVFDALLQQAELPGTFIDPGIPAGYAPHNVLSIGRRILVAYARQDNDQREAVAGPGMGYISEFDTEGNFVRRFASRNALNAPWALAVAPADFGPYSEALLVGNYGDGRIHAYNVESGDYLGLLADGNGQPIVISGLHGLAFRIGLSTATSRAPAYGPVTLYFTAGLNQRRHGLLGRIEYVSPVPRIIGTPVSTRPLQPCGEPGLEGEPCDPNQSGNSPREPNRCVSGVCGGPRSGKTER